jgi:hypothetical protein
VLRNLLTESLKIPINFDYEVRPIQFAVNSANDWMRKNFDILQHLQLLHDAIDIKTAPEIETGKETDIVFDNLQVEEDTTSVVEDLSSSVRLATEADLQALLGGAASLAVDFPTLRLVTVSF